MQNCVILGQKRNDWVTQRAVTLLFFGHATKRPEPQPEPATVSVGKCPVKNNETVLGEQPAHRTKENSIRTRGKSAASASGVGSVLAPSPRKIVETQG